MRRLPAEMSEPAACPCAFKHEVAEPSARMSVVLGAQCQPDLPVRLVDQRRQEGQHGRERSLGVYAGGFSSTAVNRMAAVMGAGAVYCCINGKRQECLLRLIVADTGPCAGYWALYDGVRRPVACHQHAVRPGGC